MGSYVGEGLFFDRMKVDSLYLFRFDIFNIKLSSQEKICLLIDYSLINWSMFLFSFLFSLFNVVSRYKRIWNDRSIDYLFVIGLYCSVNVVELHIKGGKVISLECGYCTVVVLTQGEYYRCSLSNRDTKVYFVLDVK